MPIAVSSAAQQSSRIFRNPTGLASNKHYPLTSPLPFPSTIAFRTTAP